MIDLYTRNTPAGCASRILLEELALPHRVLPVSLAAAAQRRADPHPGQHRLGYRMISPNETIPAIVDPDGPEGAPITVCEWGAIAIYLAEKAGRLLPAGGTARYATLEWLSFQLSVVAPIIAQADHFVNAEQEHRYAEERFGGEAARIYHALDVRLSSVDFLAGDLSVADIGTFPWVRDPDRVDLELATYPNVARWIERLESRASVRAVLTAPLAGADEE